MRILLCSHVYPPDRGGVSAFIHDLVGLFRRGGEQTFVLHELGCSESRLCRPVASLMGRHRRSRTGMPLRFLHFLCAVIAFRPQVVITSTWLHYGLPAVLLAPIFRYKVIIQVHGTEVLGRFKYGRRRQVMLRVLGAADLLWPNSHDTAALLSTYGYSEDEMQIVHPFLSADLLEVAEVLRAHPKAQPPLILTAGFLYPRKGIDIVLQALAMLKDLEWTYAIAGAEALPGYRQYCETLAQDLGLAHRVSFLGHVKRSELWKLMARAAIFVLTSRPDPDDTESFGIVYIEAQAFGAACIAANVAGVSDAIGDAGALIPPEAPEALAAVLREWLQHPELVAHYGARGRARVLSHFTEDARRAEIMSYLNTHPEP